MAQVAQAKEWGQNTGSVKRFFEMGPSKQWRHPTPSPSFSTYASVYLSFSPPIDPSFLSLATSSLRSTLHTLGESLFLPFHHPCLHSTSSLLVIFPVVVSCPLSHVRPAFPAYFRGCDPRHPHVESTQL